MMILADFYIAVALLLVAFAGALLAWQAGFGYSDKKLARISAVLFVLAGLDAVGCMIYYGKHFMDRGVCPYSEPLVPCPTQTESQALPSPEAATPEDVDKESSFRRSLQPEPAKRRHV
jgi:hypothetical protein